MTDLQSLIRLQTWLSPAFPTGAFSYSHGLEAAIANGWIVDKTTLQDWLATLLTSGTGWNDGVLCAESWRSASNPEALSELAELGEALCFSAERKLETQAQGAAFLKAAKPWSVPNGLPADCALPVAVGAVAGANKTLLFKKRLFSTFTLSFQI